MEDEIEKNKYLLAVKMKQQYCYCDGGDCEFCQGLKDFEVRHYAPSNN